MRVDLFLAVIAVITAADSTRAVDDIPESLNDLPARKPASYENIPECRSPFTYYDGWCAYKTDPTYVHYQEAVDTCANLGVFAPSIHSQEDIDLWVEYVKAFTNTSQKHFWLDVYCPENGIPYVWRDGTATDYYGPSNELLKCDNKTGRHIETNGLASASIDPIIYAAAVCAYRPIPPTKSNDCTCNLNKIFLDIVFVVDTSADMARDTVGDATATIQSTLYGLTFGTDYFQSNVAALAFAESVQTIRDFGGFKTTKDITSFSLPYLGGSPTNMDGAIKQASSMIAANARNFTRGVIVLLTNSFYQSGKSNIENVADSFKESGGIIITIDYSKGLGIKDLENIASPGFYINDTTTNPQLDGDILYALCDANCFCREGLVTYSAPNDRGRDVPTGCYHVADFSSVYAAAEDNCQSKNGFVATIHDDAKNFFMISLFPPKSRFWIGLTRNGDKFEWADGSTDKSTSWAAGNPIAGQDCVYAQQQTGFNSAWFSAPCTDPLKNSMTYACQIRPCDTEYDCHM